MNRCRGTFAACDGVDIRPVKLPLRSTVVPWCAACRATSAGMGVTVAIVERRVADVPVAEDRRRFVPVWARHLAAKVLDHGRAA